MNYHFKIQVNWLCDTDLTYDTLIQIKHEKNTQKVQTHCPFDFTKRFWRYILKRAEIRTEKQWCHLTKKELQKLLDTLSKDHYTVTGKSTFKEEFVTAGGVCLSQIDFKHFSSKKQNNLYFVGETLNIDALTGGFNFQNAWTSAYIASQNIALP